MNKLLERIKSLQEELKVLEETKTSLISALRQTDKRMIEVHAILTEFETICRPDHPENPA